MPLVNGNIPYFTASDLTSESFEYYSDLDNLGRCGTAYASVGTDLMPTEKQWFHQQSEAKRLADLQI